MSAWQRVSVRVRIRVRLRLLVRVVLGVRFYLLVPIVHFIKCF